MEKNLSESMKKYLLRSMNLKNISKEQYGMVKKVIINGKQNMQLTECVFFPNLEKIIISNYNLTKEEIDFLGNFPKLKVLQIDNIKIEGDLFLIGSIEKLYIANTDSIFNINLKNLKKLSYLRLYNCEGIESLDVTNLLSLKEININNSIISNLNGVDSLLNLKKINLDGSIFHKGFEFPANNNLQISNQKEYFLAGPEFVFIASNKRKRV